MPRGVPSPTTRARRARRYCPRCGNKSVVADENDPRPGKHWGVGSCFNCGATESEWEFLRAMPPDVDRTIVLHCPYAARYPGKGGSQWDDEAWHAWYDAHGHDPCPGTFEFKVAALTPSFNTGGNGPWTYGLICRFGLQGRCRACDQWASGGAFMTKRNLPILREAWGLNVADGVSVS